MPLNSLIPEALATFVAKPGSPGAAGGPLGGPPPRAGAGWELLVVSAADYSTPLAWVPPRLWNGNQFSAMLNSQSQGTQGSGTVTLAMDDPWWGTTTVTDSAGSHPAHYLLDLEHLWQVQQDGVVRFEWLGETVTEQLVQPGEQRLVIVAGPDTSQMLNWASAMPAGFPGGIVYKTSALTDSFSGVNVSGQFVLDTGLWNATSGTGVTINPSGSAQVAATAGGTVLGSTTWDLTSSLFSAQVSPVVSPDALNNVLNGSQLTQMYLEDTSGSGYYVMIALSGTTFYAAYNGPDGTYVHTIDSAAGYAAEQSSNGGYTSWQVSEAGGSFFFWTSSDGQSWTRRWAKTANWTASSVGVFFAAAYSGSTAEFATVTSINPDVSGTTLGGPVYLNQPIMAVWLQTLAAARARGTVPWVQTRATVTADSYGSPWTDSVSVQVQNGTSLYQMLQGQAAMINADWMVTPGFELVVGIPAPATPNQTNVTLGYDRSAYVRFYEAGGETAKQRQRARNQIANLVAAINADGRTVTASNSSSIAQWKQREAWVQAAAQVTELDVEVVAVAAAEVNSDQILSWTLQIPPNQPGRTVFRDFGVGDWVGLERPDFTAVDAVRVVGITVSIDSNGTETHELVLVSYLQWLQQQLSYIQAKMGGGFVTAPGTTLVAGNAQGSTQQTPTVFTETYGYLGTAGGTGGSPMVYNSLTGKWVPAGTIDPVSGQTVNLAVGGAGSATVISATGFTVGGGSGSPGPLNANYAFPGGSSAGWGVQSATLSVLAAASVPGKPPAAFAAKITPTGASGVWLTTQTGGSQVPTILTGLVPGGSYAVTAYVYLASQSDMKISVKVDWYNSHGTYLSTTTGTAGAVGAAAWQQVTVGAVPPLGAVQCNIFIGPHTGVVTNPLYVTDFYIYNAAFGTSSSATVGTVAVGASGTTVTDGSGATRVVTGLQSDGTVTSRTFNAPPPLAPDPPLTVNTMLGVNVSWDGLLGGVSYGSGSAPLLDFLHVQVHASTTSGFTPSSATLQAVLARPGNITLTQLNAGTAYYFVLVAENNAGALSPASAQAAGTPASVAQNIPAGSIGQGQLSFTVGTVTFSNTAPPSPQLSDLWYDGSNGNELKQWGGTSWNAFQFGTNALVAASVTTALLAANAVTAAKIAANTITAGQIASGTITANQLAVGTLVNQNVYFAGGDVTGWTGFGGVLTGTVSPPAGSPFPAAAKLVTDGATTAPAVNMTTGTAFPAVASSFYLATAWVFTAQTSVNLGFSWYNASAGLISTVYTTTTVTASTWTQVSALLQAPALTASAVISCGLPSVPANGTILYAEEVRLFSPFNGGIIQAGSIQTAQLAAGAVTTATLAANAVTAAKIAANTITAAQIAAGTITATQIASGTITGTQIAASVSLTSPVITGGTVTGAHLVASGSTGELLLYSGTPAAGNMIGSWSAVAGTDSHTNAYGNGLYVYDTSGGYTALVPNASGQASYLLMQAGGGTPAQISGSVVAYATGHGNLQMVDGSDGETYGASRRSLHTANDQTVSSGTFGTLQTSVLAGGTGSRSYRVHGAVNVSPQGSVGKPGIRIDVASIAGAAGLVTSNWSQGANFYDPGGSAVDTSLQPNWTMTSGTELVFHYDCVITCPSGSTGSLNIQGATTGSSWLAKANSFVDIEII